MIRGSLSPWSRSAARGVARGVVAAVAVVGLMTACAGEGERGADMPAPARGDSVTQLPEPAAGGALSEALMIALAQAKNYHHKADVYLQEGDVAQAITAVERVLSISFPADAPEGEDVMLDARARLAKLLLSRGDRDQALRAVEDGIGAAGRRSFFLANLYTVKGEVFEAMALALHDPERADVRVSDSDRARASDLRREAIAAFDESIQINQALQAALMNRGGPKAKTDTDADADTDTDTDTDRAAP